MANWFSHCGDQCRGFPKTQKELPHNPANLLLHIYPKEMKSGYWRDVCTPLFIAALFTTAKICPSVDECIKKMWYICTVEYYSVMRKDKILQFVTTWMDLEGICWDKSDRERQIVYISYLWNLKKSEPDKTKDGMVVIRGWGWGMGEMLFRGTDFSLGDK